MKERRAHARYPTGEYGILRKADGESEARELVAYVTNVSAYGLGVQIDRPITVGAPVTVFVASCTFAGTIVYCRRDSEAYAAGIALRCDTDQSNPLLSSAHSRVHRFSS